LACNELRQLVAFALSNNMKLFSSLTLSLASSFFLSLISAMKSFKVLEQSSKILDQNLFCIISFPINWFVLINWSCREISLTETFFDKSIDCFISSIDCSLTTIDSGSFSSNLDLLYEIICNGCNRKQNSSDRTIRSTFLAFNRPSRQTLGSRYIQWRRFWELEEIGEDYVVSKAYNQFCWLIICKASCKFTITSLLVEV